MKFSFQKSEKLISKKTISSLFEKGNFSFNTPPFRFVFKFTDNQSANCAVLITAAKKNQSSAVSRNRIRRQLRELYRLNKGNLLAALEKNQLQIALLISYPSKKELIYKSSEQTFVDGLNKLINEIEKGNPNTVFNSN